MAVKSLKVADENCKNDAVDEEEEEEIYNDCKTTNEDLCLVVANNNDAENRTAASASLEENATSKTQHHQQAPLSFLMSSLSSLVGPNVGPTKTTATRRSLSSSSSSSALSSSSSLSCLDRHSSVSSVTLVCLGTGGTHQHAVTKKLRLSGGESPNKSKFNTLRRKLLSHHHKKSSSPQAESSSSSMIKQGSKKSHSGQQHKQPSLPSNHTKRLNHRHHHHHHHRHHRRTHSPSPSSLSIGNYFGGGVGVVIGAGESVSTLASTTTSGTQHANKMKFLLVGDANCGKSAIMASFLHRVFNVAEYRPTIVDDYEDWETLRIMAYPETDVIILCFSVVRPDSMDNILTKWLPELNKFIPGAIIILVGTQCDLRDPSRVVGGGGATTTGSSGAGDSDPKRRHISTQEGEELRKKIKACKYIECSAVTQLNINEIFNASVEAYAKSSAAQKRKRQQSTGGGGGGGGSSGQQASCFHSLLVQLASSFRRRFSFNRSQRQQHDKSKKASKAIHES